MGRPYVRTVDAPQLGQLFPPVTLIDDIEPTLFKWTADGFPIGAVTRVTTNAYNGEASGQIAAIATGADQYRWALRRASGPRTPQFLLNAALHISASSADAAYGVWFVVNRNATSRGGGFLVRPSDGLVYRLTASATIASDAQSLGAIATGVWTHFQMLVDLTANTITQCQVGGTGFDLNTPTLFTPAGLSVGEIRIYIGSYHTAAGALTTLFDNVLCFET